jgi:hypothetical protein
MSIARITIIQLHETPKYLLSAGRDEEVVSGLQVSLYIDTLLSQMLSPFEGNSG